MSGSITLAGRKMGFGRSLSRSFARKASREIRREFKKSYNYSRSQREAAARPESILVTTAFGDFWMSPIEFKLYTAMLELGLSPRPQYGIDWYIVDFAFPDVRLAVEADGVFHRTEERRTKDKQRDWILRRNGWTVKRFYGTTIHDRASNCAYVVKQEVEDRLSRARARERQQERTRQKVKEDFARPFRNAANLFKRRKT